MYTLKKEERLCNKKLIDGLYHNGSSFLCYPFKVAWQYNEVTDENPVQVLFAVSKKKFKRAVDRNRLKRMMREAYRLNKQELLYQQLESSGKKIVFSIGFIGKELVPYQFTEKKMIKLLKQLSAAVLA